MAELRYVKLKDIKVGKRFRTDYDISEEFLNSIREKGIIQPVTLNENLELQAGGRRYTGAAMLQLEELPALIRSGTEEVDLREVELIENIHRKDMTWQERAALVSHIHALKGSMEQTAKFLDKSIGSVHKDVKLAEAIKANPAIAKIKNEKDVKRLLDKLQNDDRIKTLREDQKARIKKSGLTLIERGESNFRIQDAFEGLEEYIRTREILKSESMITLIEVDPPYGIDLNKVKKQEGAKIEESHLGIYKEVSGEEYPHFLERLCKLLYKAAAPDAWVIFWFGPTWFNAVKQALIGAGFQVDDIPAIWVRGASDSEGAGQTNAPRLYLGRAYEPFFIARKGSPVIQKQGRSNIFHYPAVKPSQKYHPTQKPVDLLEDIIETFWMGTGPILIPFLGSGTTIKAAYRKHADAFGFELNEHNKEHFLISLEEDMNNVN